MHQINEIMEQFIIYRFCWTCHGVFFFDLQQRISSFFALKWCCWGEFLKKLLHKKLGAHFLLELEHIFHLLLLFFFFFIFQHHFIHFSIYVISAFILLFFFLLVKSYDDNVFCFSWIANRELRTYQHRFWDLLFFFYSGSCYLV